jgi:DNA-binding transcriptional MerR regulator
MPRQDESDSPQDKGQFSLWVAREQIRNLRERVFNLERIDKETKDENEELHEKLETRIRVLEDYKLTMDTRIKDLVKWLTITAAALSGIVSLVEHLIFK